MDKNFLIITLHIFIYIHLFIYKYIYKQKNILNKHITIIYKN